MMQDRSPSDPEALIRQLEEQKKTLQQKLSESLDKNKTLHERLAELHIHRTIEKAELKREIEQLNAEKKDLLEEHEGLLKELSSQEDKTREYLRSLEVKQLFLRKTEDNIGALTEQVRQWESKCREWEGRVGELEQEKSALADRGTGREGEFKALREQADALKRILEEKEQEKHSLNGILEELNVRMASLQSEKETVMKEHDNILGQKNSQIEALAKEMKSLRGEYESVLSKKDDFERETGKLKEKVSSLEYLVSLKEKALQEQEHGLREREEFYRKLEENRMEILSLAESRESLTETLKERDEEVELLKADMENALAEKDKEFGKLRTDYEEKMTKLTEEIKGLRGEHDFLSAQRTDSEKEMVNLREKLSFLEYSLSLKEKVLQEQEHGLKEREELYQRLEESRNNILSLAESRESLTETLKEREEEVELLKADMENALAEKDNEFGRLREDYEEKLARLTGEIKGLKGDHDRILSLREDSERETGKLREKISSLEYLLSLKEKVLQEQEHGLKEREEFYRKLEESRREILSLTEFRESLTEVVKEREEEVELLKADMENALAEKDAEFKELMEEYEAQIAKITEEKASAESGLREIQTLTARMEEALAEKDGEIEKLRGESGETAKKLSEEKSSLESRVRETEEHLTAALNQHSRNEALLQGANEKISQLGGLLSEKERGLSAAEEELRQIREKAAFLGQRVHERDQTLSSVEENLRDTREEAASLTEAVSQTEKTVEGLRDEIALHIKDRDTIGRERDSLSAALAEAEALKNTLTVKIAGLEEVLRKEIAVRVDLQNTLARTEGNLGELKSYHESESVRLNHEIQRLAAETSRANQEIKRLEEEGRGRMKRVAEQDEKLSEYEKGIERQKGEIERFRGDANRLESDLASLAETSRREKQSLEDALSQKEAEVRDYGKKLNDLEVDFAGASQKVTFLEELIMAKENAVKKAEMMVKGYETLTEENGRLQGRLEDMLKEADALRDVREFLSSEIKRLEGELKGLRDESETHRHILKQDLDGAFARISESTGRLEHTISEGMELAKRLGEISAASLDEHLPVRTSSIPLHVEGKYVRRSALIIAVPLVILGVVLGVLFRESILLPLRSAIPAKPASPPSLVKSWAEGVKQKRAGEYTATLIFLNREAVSALGLSGKITDAGMAENHYALLEIKAENGCISDDFLLSFDKNIVFITKDGTEVPLNVSGSLSEEKRVVHKSNVCNRKTAAVYMKGIVSVGRKFDIRGMNILGLDTQSPIALR